MVTRLEAIDEQIERRLTSLDNRMTSLDNRVDGRFTDLENRIDSRFTALENRLNVQMHLTIGMWITTIVAVLATLVTILLRL